MAGKPRTGNRALGHLELIERPGFVGLEPQLQAFARAPWPRRPRWC
jgi:hypothetical protein